MVGGVVVEVVVIQSSMLVSGGCLCSWLVRLRGSVATTLTLDVRVDTAEGWIGYLLVEEV